MEDASSTTHAASAAGPTAGLPGETDADVLGIAETIEWLQQECRSGKWHLAVSEAGLGQGSLPLLPVRANLGVLACERLGGRDGVLPWHWHRHSVLKSSPLFCCFQVNVTISNFTPKPWTPFQAGTWPGPMLRLLWGAGPAGPPACPANAAHCAPLAFSDTPCDTNDA